MFKYKEIISGVEREVIIMKALEGLSGAISRQASWGRKRLLPVNVKIVKRFQEKQNLAIFSDLNNC